MRSGWRAAAAGCATVALLLLPSGPEARTEGHVMTILSSPSEPIGWQGAAGRTPDRFLVLRVTSVHAEGPGPFGIRRSPSIAGYLPDAHVLEGRAGEQGVRVRLPGPELKGTARGDLVALGLVGDHAICLLRPPAGMAEDAVAAWAKTRPCP